MTEIKKREINIFAIWKCGLNNGGHMKIIPIEISYTKFDKTFYISFFENKQEFCLFGIFNSPDSFIVDLFYKNIISIDKG